MPLLIEELWFKPLIWGLPLLPVWFAEKKRPELFKGNIFKGIGFGVGLGLMYMLVVLLVGIVQGGSIKVNDLSGIEQPFLDILGITLATAIIEETVFAGYVFSKIRTLFSGFWPAGIVTAVMFASIHIPIGVFIYQYSDLQMIGFLLLVGVVSLGHYWVMEKSRNIAGPIMSHWIWAMAIAFWG